MATSEETRAKIVKEIVDTETNYIASLQDYIISTEKAAQPHANDSKEIMIQRTLLREQRLNLQSIIDISAQKIEGWTKSVDPLSDMMTFFSTNQSKLEKEYSTYLSKYTGYTDLILKNPDLIAVDKARADSNEGRSSLASLAIMPVQRVPRYVLLLNEVLKNTPSKSEEHAKLNTVLQDVKHVGTAINEAIRTREAWDSFNAFNEKTPNLSISRAIEGKDRTTSEIEILLKYGAQIEMLKKNRPSIFNVLNRDKRALYDTLIAKVEYFVDLSDTYVKGSQLRDHDKLLGELAKASAPNAFIETLEAVSKEIEPAKTQIELIIKASQEAKKLADPPPLPPRPISAKKAAPETLPPLPPRPMSSQFQPVSVIKQPIPRIARRPDTKSPVNSSVSSPQVLTPPSVPTTAPIAVKSTPAGPPPPSRKFAPEAGVASPATQAKASGVKPAEVKPSGVAPAAAPLVNKRPAPPPEGALRSSRPTPGVARPPAGPARNTGDIKPLPRTAGVLLFSDPLHQVKKTEDPTKNKAPEPPRKPPPPPRKPK